MKLARRGFMRFLGAGAAGAPLLAKSPASLAGIGDGLGVGVPAIDTGSVASFASSAGQGGNPDHWVNPVIARSNYLKLVGKLPDFIEEQLREQAKFIGALDPDIAVLRSFSLSAKVAWQRERNYERMLAAARKQGPWETAMKAFEKVAGFRWSLW